MEARHFAWTFCLFALANIVSEAEGYTCTYNDIYGDKHTLYCGDDYCCGSKNNRYCCNRAGEIAAAVVGSVVFVIIVASIVSCCFCACCPAYRYRNREPIIITTTAPNYQAMPNTTAVQTGPYSGQPAGAYTGQPAGAYTGQPTSYQG